MIAVFTRTQRQFDDREYTPKELFIRVRSTNEIRGRNFAGAIFAYGWEGSYRLAEALEMLKKRQPELFKD